MLRISGVTAILALTLAYVAPLLGADVQLVTNPQSTTVIEGDNATFICQVAHVPGDELTPVQWMKGHYALGSDKALKNWDRYSMTGDVSLGYYNLRIMNAGVFDDDSFQCQVTEYFIESKRVKLTVLVPPKGPFVDGRKDNGIVRVDVVLGKEVTIPCTASNAKPAATVFWYKDGRMLDNVNTSTTPPRKKLRNTIATLRLTPELSDIDATYNCVIKHDAIPSTEQLHSQMVKLQVVDPPVVSIMVPALVKEGLTIVVQCQTDTASSDIMDYRWFVNDDLMANNKERYNLGLANKTWHNAMVGCQARNKAGYSKISSAQLNVLYAPVFIGENSKTEAVIGDNVTLQCRWESNPEPLVHWTREGDDRIIATGNTLILKNVQQINSGSYECQAIATNVGSNVAVVAVIVNGPPIFSSPPIQYTNSKDPAVIKCALNSSPGIEQVVWTWKKDGISYTLRDNEVKMESNNAIKDVKYKGNFESRSKIAILEIFQISDEDLHAYSCKVSNTYGNKKMEIKLEDSAVPRKSPADPKVIIIAAVVGGVAFLVVVVVLAFYCSRSKRKITKKEIKEATTDQGTATARNSQNNYENFSPAQRDNCYHVTTASTFHATTPPSTVFGSDDTNPNTVLSTHDDGYSTGENNSWIRKSATPVKNVPESVSYVPGLEKVDLCKPLLQRQHGSFAGGDKATMSSFSSFHHQSHPYDPTAFVHLPPLRDQRPSSESPECIVPHPDYSGFRFQPQITDERPYEYAPMRPAATPIHFETSAYNNRNPGASNPAKIWRNDRCLPDCPSQASIELPLGASAIETFNIAGRSSTMSGASQNSDLSRPLISKMATHV